MTLCGRATCTTRITNATSWRPTWPSATRIKSASAGDGTISAVRKQRSADADALARVSPFAHALLNACTVAALRCPPGKEYQACVSTCTSRTCLNREYYEESTCSFIREECVCRSGTILHRADSPYCVTEDRCGEPVITSLLSQRYEESNEATECEKLQISITMAQCCIISASLLGSDVFSLHG